MQNYNFSDFIFSFGGVIFFLLAGTLIYSIYRIVQIISDNKNEKDKILNNKSKKDEIHFESQDSTQSPTPLTTQKILENTDKVSNEELYERDCTIEKDLTYFEEDFEEMKEEEIVIDVPINPNANSKENDNNEL